MEFNYLYGKQADQFSYVSIPKILITEKAFSDVSLEAKMLYGLILERMGMYQEQKWQDEVGRVYVIYPIDEIREDMNRSEENVKVYLSELETVGLLERKHNDPELQQRLYLKRLSYTRGLDSKPHK